MKFSFDKFIKYLFDLKYIEKDSFCSNYMLFNTILYNQEIQNINQLKRFLIRCIEKQYNRFYEKGVNKNYIDNLNNLIEEIYQNWECGYKNVLKSKNMFYLLDKYEKEDEKYKERDYNIKLINNTHKHYECFDNEIYIIRILNVEIHIYYNKITNMLSTKKCKIRNDEFHSVTKPTTMFFPYIIGPPIHFDLDNRPTLLASYDTKCVPTKVRTHITIDNNNTKSNQDKGVK